MSKKHVKKWKKKRDKARRQVEGELKPRDGIKDYFQTFANTRASAAMLTATLSGAVIMGLNLISYYFYFKEGHQVNPFSSVFFNLIFSCFCFLLVVGILPFTGKWLYRHQLLSTSLLFVAVLVLQFSLNLLSLAIFTSSLANKDFVRGIDHYGWFGILLILATFIAWLIYHSLDLSRRLKDGFTEEKSGGSYKTRWGKLAKYIFPILGFSLILLLLFGGFGIAFGLFSMILFNFAFCQYLLELAYLIRLKTKSKDYWEEMPDPVLTVIDWLKVIDVRKSKHRIWLEGIFLVLLILTTQWLGPQFYSKIWVKNLAKFTIYGILIDSTLSFLYNKLKNKDA